MSRVVDNKPNFKDELLTKVDKALKTYCKDPQQVDIVESVEPIIPDDNVMTKLERDAEGNISVKEWMSEIQFHEQRFPGTFQTCSQGGFAAQSRLCCF